MKNFINIFRISLVALVISFAVPLFGQNGNPPPPPGGHGGNTNVPGGGAPIGEGLLVLATLAAAYGVRKWKSGKTEQED
ncbi:MAG TPA: hypothetical protein VFC92_11685 [Bacteroidales bacterium]|nr:hypothetical protein [Bacteroidales bacterium]